MKIPAENQLLTQLPRKERTSVLAHCETVDLTLSTVMSEPGELARYAYFPQDGFLSLIALVDDKPGIEVGMIGREGMLGVHVALGVLNSPVRSLVQGTGHALRIEAKALGTLLKNSMSLQSLLGRYTYVVMAQLATSSACLRFHHIDQRLARWLLMSQDRACANTFKVTHEFLAYMLGVRRVSVTNAAGALQSQGLIAYHRGDITVTNRAALERVACNCYASDSKVYSSFMR